MAARRRVALVTGSSRGLGSAIARRLTRELAAFGITVNAVAPGFIPVERHADVPAEVREVYRASVPAGRLGTPDDVAHVVGFLAAEQAGFLTGQRIVVDGGRSLRDCPRRGPGQL